MDISTESIQPANNLNSQNGHALDEDELFTIEEIIDREMDDLSQLDEKYCEDTFYYGWFIDEIFGYESTCSRQDFAKVLETAKFNWLFNTVEIRNKVLKKL